MSLNAPHRRALHLGTGLNSFGWPATFMGCNFAVQRVVHTTVAASHLPEVVRSDRRTTWIIQAAFMIGMARGSLPDHIVYLSE